MQGFEGRTVFISGGASGIGLGLARAFGSAGANVCIGDIDPPALDRAQENIRVHCGAAVLGVSLDVTSRASWDEASARAVERFGSVDVLCNNAGVGNGTATLADVPLQDWRWVFAVNVEGMLNGIQAFVPRFLARGRGHVVNTASLAAMFTNPTLGAYSASKFAALGLSETLRQELAPHGIGVSVICPGMVRTNFVRTTARLTPSLGGRAPVESAGAAAIGAGLESGMDPDSIGERTVRAVLGGEFYVMTHPEYRDIVERRFCEILAAFGESAQPGYRDDFGYQSDLAHDAG
ncbi:MAG: SDR family oxidoreductase [Gammaproteobacteria bacterium]